MSSKNSDWENWTVEKGDYHRGYHSTSRFEKKIKRQRKIKNGIIISVFFVVIAVITYFVLK